MSKTDQARQETIKHQDTVRGLVMRFVDQLSERARSHDDSKLLPPEADLFAEYTSKLAGTTYGSDEYKRFLVGLKPALDHHYAENRHHPEHFSNGINGMTLVDLVEMLCDWKAATLRHNDGDILRSIEINAGRFGISPQLVQILKNTVEQYGIGGALR
jgi:hypothetical protein